MLDQGWNLLTALLLAPLLLLPAEPALVRNTAGPKAATSPSPGATPQAAADLRLIADGNFTPVALGPDVYEAVLARVRSRPREYLGDFQALYLGPDLDAFRLSQLQLPTLLRHLADQEPTEVRSIARRLLQRYDGILLIYDHCPDQAALLKLLDDETARFIKRLQARRSELRELISPA